MWQKQKTSIKAVPRVPLFLCQNLYNYILLKKDEQKYWTRPKEFAGIL